MYKKRMLGFAVIMAIVFIGDRFCYGMGKKPSKPIQEETSNITVIEDTSQQQMPLDSSLLPEQSATPQTIQATQTVTILPAELAEDKTTRTRQIQSALKNAGYDPGPVDGRMGVKTMSAIREFQKANNLTVDGKVGPKTWSVLGEYYARE